VKFSLVVVAALLCAVTPPAIAQVAILHIQVIEGEGAVRPPGSRSMRPLTVQVTDETGKPVEGAAVSFRLPEEGPGGTFTSGLRTDVVISDNLGRATAHGLQANRTAGRFQVRIVASKEQARAGTVCWQYVSDGGAVAASGSGTTPPSGRGPRASRGLVKWIALAAALVGGGVAAGALAAGKSGSGPTPPGAAAPVVTIGTPTITVGKP
jgi:hypothetical protein